MLQSNKSYWEDYMTDILIKNGLIATMNRERTVFRKGSLYIKDDRIADVGRDLNVSQAPEIVINAEGKVVLPGFVNVHSHLQQYFRGVYEYNDDFFTVNLPLEGYRRPEDMRDLGLASCAEFIYGGSTTAMVTYTYPDGFAEAVAVAGNRVILGADIEEVNLERLKQGVYEYLPEKGEAAFKRATDLYDNWHGKAEGRISVVMAPKASDLAPAQTYSRCKEFADQYGLRVTTHLSQNWREVKQVEKLYGKTPPQHLFDLGVLNSRLTGAHCSFATEKDFKLIAAAGVGILHCRAVTNPFVHWMEMGIRVGLGTDDFHHDMLHVIRQNLIGQRTRARLVGGAEEMQCNRFSPARPTFYEFLEMATRGGAEVLGIDKEVGS